MLRMQLPFWVRLFPILRPTVPTALLWPFAHSPPTTLRLADTGILYMHTPHCLRTIAANSMPGNFRDFPTISTPTKCCAAHPHSSSPEQQVLRLLLVVIRWVIPMSR